MQTARHGQESNLCLHAGVHVQPSQRPEAAAAAGFCFLIFGGGLKRNTPQVKQHGPSGPATLGLGSPFAVQVFGFLVIKADNGLLDP